MSEIHDIVGYEICATCRNHLVLDVVAARTGGQCLECFKERGKLESIEVDARGARLAIPLRPKRKQSEATKQRSPEAVERRKQVEKCRDRARKRLQAIFPDLYDILYAEERAAVGLDPWPVEVAIRGAEDPDGTQTVDFATVYHSLEEHGVDE